MQMYNIQKINAVIVIKMNVLNFYIQCIKIFHITINLEDNRYILSNGLLQYKFQWVVLNNE